MRPRVPGLRFLVVVGLLLTVVPVGVALVVDARNERGHQRAEARDASRSAVETVLALQAARVAGARGTLEALAALPEVTSMGDGCPAALAAALGALPDLANLAVADAQGTVRCSAVPAGGAVDVSDRAYFRRALETGRFAVGEYVVGRITGEPALGAALPVEGPAGRGAVLSAALELGFVADAVEVASLPEGSAVAVVDREGTLLARVPPVEGIGAPSRAAVVREILRRDAGTTVARGVDGIERLYAFQEVPGAGGSVYAGIPTAAAFAPADREFRADLLTAAGLVVGSAAIALALAEVLLIRPMRRLARTADDLRTGRPDARAALPAGGETGALGAAIDDLAASLQQRDATLRQMLTALVESGEDERRRIAGGVHDDSVQAMTAQVLGLQLLRRRLAGTEHEAAVADLEVAASAAVDRLRDLIFELHSPVLEHGGIEDALEALLARTLAHDGTDWRLACDLAAEPPPLLGATVYRIAQEAIANAGRHAAARTVSVSLSHREGTLVLRVEDDGRGIAGSADAVEAGHAGVATMRRRAELMGGTVTLGPRPGGGTAVECRLPWGALALPPDPAPDQPPDTTSRTIAGRSDSPDPFAR